MNMLSLTSRESPNLQRRRRRERDACTKQVIFYFKILSIMILFSINIEALFSPIQNRKRIDMYSHKLTKGSGKFNVPHDSMFFKLKSKIRYNYCSTALKLSTLQEPLSFKQRMHNMIRNKRNAKSSSQKMDGALESLENYKLVHTLEEYKAVVADEKEKIVVVVFFATWCKVCRRIIPLLLHVARTNPNVLFTGVPISSKNIDLHQGLGVERVPFCHIYHPDGGLVEELRLTRKSFSDFKTKLKWYTDGFCDSLSIKFETQSTSEDIQLENQLI